MVDTTLGRPEDLLAALAEKPAANLDTDGLERIRAAGAHLGSFDGGDITLGHFSGQSPWERHVDGDELFYVIDGAVEVTLLTEPDSSTVVVARGSIFVIPKGHWHRLMARSAVKLLTLRATAHGPVSFADDPRLEASASEGGTWDPKRNPST